MFDKPTASHVTSLEIDGSTLRVVQLALNRGRPSLEKCQEVPVTDHVNALYILDDEKGLQESAKNRLLVTVLGSQEVLVRPLEVKLKKESDINSVLAFQAEPLLPYPVENAILDRITLSTTSDSTLLNIFAARKDHIQAHLALWNDRKIDPEVISCAPFALAQFSKLFCSTVEPHFLVHIGQTQTTCILVKQGKLLAAQVSYTGTQNLQEQDAEAIEQWRLDTIRILYALAKQRKEQDVAGVLITGEGASKIYLGTSIEHSLNKPLIPIVENSQFPLPTEELQRYAIPIGAALSGLDGHEQINFRQQEFAYSRPWNRLKKPLFIYYLLSLGLAIALYLFGESYLGYEEDKLKEEYVELLASMNKTYSSFEKDYLKKYPSQDNFEGIQPIDAVTQAGIAHRLEYLQSEMKDNPNLFPLLPNTPKVSDVLAWLSNHPIVVGKPHDKSEGSETSLQVDNFSYTMVKRPDLKKTQEKYQVKVELEFSTSTPKLAREFHDALIAPNEIVDPKGEVKWSSNRGKYRTSFFLKDKTVYP